MYMALFVSGTQGNVPEPGNTFSVSMSLSGKDAVVICLYESGARQLDVRHAVNGMYITL